MQVAQGYRGWSLSWQPTALLLGLALVSLNLTALLGTKAAVLFLFACLWLVFRRPGAVLAEARATWLLWALVGWCLLTTFWSGAPSLTLRYGIQLAITFLIAIAAAWRLSLTSLLRVLIVSGLFIAIASLGLGRANEGGHWVGVFGSKNALAQFSTICVIAGFAVLLDRRGRGIWVWLAVALVLLGGLLLDRADSAGALIATGISVITMVGLKGLRVFSRWQRVVIVGAMALLALFGILLVTGYFAEFSRIFLQLTGKDATLTGRTTLWRHAFEQIAQHPLLGQGFKGFWVPGNPVAEAMWTEFGITSKTGFHFHNTLISNAVEIGLIGIALQAVIFFSALYVLIRWPVARPTAESLFLAGFMMRQLVLMNSELVFFTQFEPVSILTAMAYVYALRVQRDADRRRAVARAARSRRPGAMRYATPVRLREGAR